MKFFRQAALCAAILGSLVGSARAQGLGSAASISATGTSATVALPLIPASTPYKSVIIAPAAGTSVEIFYALGGASAAASATPGTVAAAGSTPSAALPSGGICLNMGSYTNIAAITGGSAATVRITQINGCTQFAGGGGSSGGGSTTANQGTAAAASGAWPFYGTVGGTALSATNGWWTNILQGNAVLSATNGLFVAPTTAASWAVTGTFWQATQPVSAISWPLPTGAATAANQNTGVADVSVPLSGMTANNAATQIALQGTASVSTLLSGTWVGTLTPQVSSDGGTTWAATLFFNPATQAFTTTVTANGTYDILGTGGKSHARVLLSPYTSGTVTGNLRAVAQAPSDAAALYGLALQTGSAGSPGSSVVTVQGVSGATPIPVTSPITGGGYPNAATAIAGNAAGTTGAVVGTLAAASAKTTYLCDFDVTALGTASSVGPIVVAGLLGGPKTYQMGTLATGTQQMLTKNFSPCLPASAVNTAITITTTADATASAVDVNSSGYQQ